MHILTIAMVALVIRYFDPETERLQYVQTSYGESMEVCESRKQQIDLKPDPPQSKTKVDCVDEKDLPRLLSGGKDI